MCPCVRVRHRTHYGTRTSYKYTYGDYRTGDVRYLGNTHTHTYTHYTVVDVHVGRVLISPPPHYTPHPPITVVGAAVQYSGNNAQKD